MGHAFQHTLMDVLIRYNTMKQKSVLWQSGIDHAGIATQIVVERQLLHKGIKRHDLGREKFIEQVWQWKELSGDSITRQMRRLGTSIDWSDQRFTLDDGFSKAVLTAFSRLHTDGLIYRGQRMVNWDPLLGTAISDLEVISAEEDGILWYFRYPLADNSDHLTVATTRPETMLGDTAVAVHPDDQRYRHLVGKQVALPLTSRTIPIIADEQVDSSFGTGCVKITPAHDFNDYKMGQRHNLPCINIMNADATMNAAVPEEFRDMDRLQAREAVCAALKARGLLEKQHKHRSNIPRGERSKAIIEPRLTKQWFVRATKLAAAAIEAVENDMIRIVPQQWKKVYCNWLHNVEDWCISRQLWWGHQIPAWYDPHGKIYVGLSEEDVRQRYGIQTPLQQDSDVLDTWFSSSLWTFATLGWPTDTPLRKKFHPTDVLVTGFDILFFWVARMVMMSIHLTGEIPFRSVYVTGLVRDEFGQKMAKSKGNVLDPLDLIDGITAEDLVNKRTADTMQDHHAQKITARTRQQFPQGITAYGTDALRFTFCSLSSIGRDIKFDIGRIEGYHHFCNKLWNAARYVLGTVDAPSVSKVVKAQVLADRWIVSQSNKLLGEIERALASYRFDFYAQSLYEFIWHQYCDWYLECAKVKEGHPSILVNTLRVVLKLLHPVMPFISEEIWRRVKPVKDSDYLLHQPFPSPAPECRDEHAEKEFAWLQKLVTTIRELRATFGISPRTALTVYIRSSDNEQLGTKLSEHSTLIASLATLSSISIGEDARQQVVATGIAGDTEVWIPLKDVIDRDSESARLHKLIHQLDKKIANLNGQLTNPQFTARAPQEVVEDIRQRLASAQNDHSRFISQLKIISDL